MDCHHSQLSEQLKALNDQTKQFDSFRKQCTAIVTRAIEGFTSGSPSSGVGTFATHLSSKNSLGWHNVTQMPSFEGVYLSARYTSLEDMWNKWWELSLHSGKPISRGFAKMEALYKAKWQSYFDGSQKCHFSRIKMIISGLSAKIAAANCSGNAIVVEYDELF